MSGRIAEERGTTLLELVAGMAVALVVLTASGVFLVNTTVRGAEVADRVDATERARGALDAVVRDLQGMVCLSQTAPPVLAADDSSVTFVADLTGAGGPPSKVRLAYDATTKTLTRSVWPGTGIPPSTTWAASPATVETLAADVVAQTGVPVLRYWAYTSTPPSVATVALTTPLSAADRARAVRVTVTLAAQTARTGRLDVRSAAVASDAWVGTADGDQPSAGPGC